MPRRKSGIKRHRADKKRRAKNLRVREELKKTLKKFQALITAKNIAEAKKALISAYSQLDKAAKKNIIHIGRASRKKSRLAQLLSKMTKGS